MKKNPESFKVLCDVFIIQENKGRNFLLPMVNSHEGCLNMNHTNQACGQKCS